MFSLVELVETTPGTLNGNLGTLNGILGTLDGNLGTLDAGPGTLDRILGTLNGRVSACFRWLSLSKPPRARSTRIWARSTRIRARSTRIWARSTGTDLTTSRWLSRPPAG
ncbi:MULTISPECIES: hypothetical protein [unclassified Gordonia (in: high G+C Gram-positive bacteria)]